MFAYLFIWPNYSDREEKARHFFSVARSAIQDSFFSHASPCGLVLAHEGPLSNQDFLVGVLLEQGPRDGALSAVQNHLVECGCPEPQEAVLAPVNALTTAENWAQQLATHGLTIVDVLVVRPIAPKRWWQFWRGILADFKAPERIPARAASQTYHTGDKDKPQINQPAGEENYRRAISFAQEGKWQEAMDELKQAVNQGHVQAWAIIDTMWCLQCRMKIAQPSASVVSDYARFWAGRCPRCKNPLTFTVQ